MSPLHASAHTALEGLTDPAHCLSLSPLLVAAALPTVSLSPLLVVAALLKGDGGGGCSARLAAALQRLQDNVTVRSSPH
jgi:hypothetical protein